jgi:hypothetical protein
MAFFSNRRSFVSLLTSLFFLMLILSAGAAMASNIIKADYTCDGRVDLDDYTQRVKSGSVDYDILIREWGKSGIAHRGCEDSPRAASPTPTPSPSPSPTPSPNSGN